MLKSSKAAPHDPLPRHFVRLAAGADLQGQVGQWVTGRGWGVNLAKIEYEVRYENKQGQYIEEVFDTPGVAERRAQTLARKGIEAEVWQVIR